MRIDWSRLPRGPLLALLLTLAVPGVLLRSLPLAHALTVTCAGAVMAILAWASESPGTTLETWRKGTQRAENVHGCGLVIFVLAGVALSWLVGWETAGRIEFSMVVVRGATALLVAGVYGFLLLGLLGNVLPTRTPVVPPALRPELAGNPRATGVPGGDPREIVPGFVADLDPAAPPPAPAALAPPPIQRVLRLPDVAPWRPASQRRLRADWRGVIGWRLIAGELIAHGVLAAAILLGTRYGVLLASLAVLAVTVAIGSRALRWEWPGEVSLADWFRSERSLVNAQSWLAGTAHVLWIGGAIVTAGEALWFQRGATTADLLCGTPLILGAVGAAMPLLWMLTVRRLVEKPAVRSAPEPIRRAVLAVARRKEHVVARAGGREEIAVVEELAGVPVVPEKVDPDSGANPAAVPAAGATAIAREAPERILAELSRAATLRSDGPALVRRLEQRLAKSGPQPEDTDLLVEVAELLFLAFPDRATKLVEALGDAFLAGAPPPKPPA